MTSPKLIRKDIGWQCDRCDRIYYFTLDYSVEDSRRKFKVANECCNVKDLGEDKK